jgi:hypothetical protein
MAQAAFKAPILQEIFFEKVKVEFAAAQKLMIIGKNDRKIICGDKVGA